MVWWNNLFAIVKYDKSTKFKNGELVRASYQMFNSLPFGTDRKTIEESMKKIVAVLLAVIVLFAFLLELGGKDKKKEWSFRSYCEYVTENVVPLPEISLNIEWDDGDGIFNRIGKFFDFIWSLVSFPFTYAFVLIKNVGVLLSGFFPISMPSDPSYSMYYFTCENVTIKFYIDFLKPKI